MIVTLQGAGCSLGDGMYTSSGPHQWAESSPHAVHPNLQNTHTHTRTEPARDYSKSAEWNVSMNEGRSATVWLHPGGSLHQVISQLHGVGRAQRQVSRQADHKDTHQRVLQQGDLGTQPQEETDQRRNGIRDNPQKTLWKGMMRAYFLSLSGGQLSHL